MRVLLVILSFISLSLCNTRAKPGEIILALYYYAYSESTTDYVFNGMDVGYDTVSERLQPFRPAARPLSLDDLYDFLLYYTKSMTRPKSLASAKWGENRLRKNQIVKGGTIDIDKTISDLKVMLGVFHGPTNFKTGDNKEESSKKFKSMLVGLSEFANEINSGKLPMVHGLDADGLNKGLKVLYDDRLQEVYKNLLQVDFKKVRLYIWNGKAENPATEVGDDLKEKAKGNMQAFLNLFKDGGYDIEKYLNSNIDLIYTAERPPSEAGITDENGRLLEEASGNKLNHISLISELNSAYFVTCNK